MFELLAIANEARQEAQQEPRYPRPIQKTDYATLLRITADNADRIFIQGKVAELRLELNSGGRKDKNHSAKKIALKKIVANMTMSNNDMVALFPDIVGCMQIPSLEIKKMYASGPNRDSHPGADTSYRCFLFLVNYARMKPDVAMKALPVLVLVGFTFQRANVVRSDEKFPGYGGLKPTDPSARSANPVLHSRPRIR